MLSRVAIDHSQSSLLDTVYLLQGHTDRDVQKQRNKPRKKQRDAVKSGYKPQPVESPLSGTHFACCKDIQTWTYRNKETKQRRNREMLSKVAIDHSQSPLLDTFCLLQGHTDRDVQKPNKQSNK